MKEKLLRKFTEILQKSDFTNFNNRFSKLFLFFSKDILLENKSFLEQNFIKKDIFKTSKIKKPLDYVAILRTKLKALDAFPSIIMRFAPSPSGELHLGHTRILSIMQFVQKNWPNTKFILRIENTNPLNSHSKFIKPIQEQVEWLGLKIDEIQVQSENRLSYIDAGLKLYIENKRYICICDSKNNPACNCKNNQNNEKKTLFFQAQFKPKTMALVMDLDLQNKNPALHKVVLLRGVFYKKKMELWPTMDFRVSVDDIASNMNFIIRGRDHEMNKNKQDFIKKALGHTRPGMFITVGRVSVTEGIMSASLITKMIKQKKLTGWRDKKTLRCRALKETHQINPEKIYKYWIENGLSKGKHRINLKKIL
jgi:glutamyl-tRNA synthetase